MPPNQQANITHAPLTHANTRVYETTLLSQKLKKPLTGQGQHCAGTSIQQLPGLTLNTSRRHLKFRGGQVKGRKREKSKGKEKAIGEGIQ